GGRTVSTAARVASSRLLMACSRPGGVSGADDGHDAFSMPAARLAADLTSFNRTCWSGVGAIAASICPNGQLAIFAVCSQAAANSARGARPPGDRPPPPVSPATCGLGPAYA